jgi:hypothetical protein
MRRELMMDGVVGKMWSEGVQCRCSASSALPQVTGLADASAGHRLGHLDCSTTLQESFSLPK